MLFWEGAYSSPAAARDTEAAPATLRHPENQMQCFAAWLKTTAGGAGGGGNLGLTPSSCSFELEEEVWHGADLGCRVAVEVIRKSKLL